MSEVNKRLPRSDFGKCVGEEVTLFLADVEQLAPLELPVDKGRLQGRLVGVDRPGVWMEPKGWFDQSIKDDSPVQHVFVKWDNVLGLTRSLSSELFEDKKEYRGLRPRG